MRRFGVVLVLLAAILGIPAPASAAAGTTTRISVAGDGSQANSTSYSSAISANGRYVTFDSFASNLAPGDTDPVRDVFVRDRVTGSIELVNLASDGTEANAASFASSISAGGRYVTFYSYADNLVPGDTNRSADMFVRDRHTGSTERVNVATDGTQDNYGGHGSVISADGRYVAFYSHGDNLVPGDTNRSVDLFVRDRHTGSTERVSVTGDGTQANGSSWGAEISPDGRYIAFNSDADNLVAGDTNGAEDMFVRNRDTGGIERINVAADGTQANGASFDAGISADGRYISFYSDADNLVAGDTNGAGDVFVHDRDTGSTERVSVAGNGTQANGTSLEPVISADGRYVAFSSGASNLVPGDTNNIPDVFVRDRDTGSTERVSVASDGTQADNDLQPPPPISGYRFRPAISGDGRYVIFYSYASNLVPDDTNNAADVFVRDRTGGAPSDTTPPVLALPGPVTVEATGPAGTIVTYTATATDDTDPDAALSCAPAPGAAFPIGTTTVECTATDAAGNQATGSFTVTVAADDDGQPEDPEAPVPDYPLEDPEETSPLEGPVETGLANETTGARDAAADGNTTAACAYLACSLNQAAGFGASEMETVPVDQAGDAAAPAPAAEETVPAPASAPSPAAPSVTTEPAAAQQTSASTVAAPVFLAIAGAGLAGIAALLLVRHFRSQPVTAKRAGRNDGH